MVEVTKIEGSWNMARGNKMDMDIELYRDKDMAMYRDMDIVSRRAREVEVATGKYMAA